MEPKSVGKPSLRRSSISEKDRLSKKANKKRKKGKKSRGVDDVDKQPPSPQQIPQCGASKVKDTGENVNNEPEQSPKASPVLSPINQSGDVVLSESPSVNTDLSESTISLISSNGNSQTNVLEPTSEPTAYLNHVEIVTESLSSFNIKTKGQGAQSTTPRTGRSQSVCNKPQQRPSVLGGVRKVTTYIKSKSSNAFVQNIKVSAKSKLPKESDKRVSGDDKLLESPESLRWELTLDDPEQEKERIKVYKINRRKRYLAAAQAKGLAWASEYSENGTPACSKDRPNKVDRRELTVQQSTPNFSTVQSLVPVPVHKVTGKIFVDC